MRRITATGIALLILGAMAAAAETPTLVIKGSDTIGGALGPAWAAAFMEETPDLTVEIESLGSSTAFAGLLDGSAHIGASSRPVKHEEVERAGGLGITLEEFVVGYDGIAVIVHPDNPINSLSLTQLEAIFSGTATNWHDVGGRDAGIRTISRPSYSGTHSFFKKRVLDGEFGPATEWMEKNREIVREVAADPAAVSYVGLGWIAPEVKAVALAAHERATPVAPNLSSVRDGSYPIYRPLLLYTAGPPLGAARRFISFVYTEHGRRLVAEHGFVTADYVPELANEEPAVEHDAANELLRIRFALSRTQLRSDDKKRLEPFAAAAKAGGGHIVISGHADSTGGPATNRRVSLARARAVAAFLVERGVPVDLLTLTGEGSDRPIASNTTAEGRWLNRRVDVQLVREH